MCLCKDARQFYKIVGLGVHVGSTIESGHYYCYGLRADNRFHMFNDTVTHPVLLSAMQDSEAYVALYERMT